MKAPGLLFCCKLSALNIGAGKKQLILSMPDPGVVRDQKLMPKPFVLGTVQA
jgi:hypothetical protein